MYSFTQPKDDQVDFYFTACVLLAELSISGFLAVNLLFVGADAKICYNLVEELLMAAKARTLDLELLHRAKDEIKRRVDGSFYSNTAVVLVAGMNVLAFNILLYLIRLSNNNPNITMTAGLYIKEFIFLGFVFVYTASVNEKADELRHFLARYSWDSIEDKELDHTRVKLFVSLIDEPISFALAGYRYKRMDIAIQVASVAISIAIPILQNLLI